MEEHQEIPTEDTVVMPVRELRKQRKVQKPEAEGRDLRIFWITEKSDSCQQKDVPSCMAWRKRKLFRKNGTPENC
jgi:hypothetical protein